MSRIGALPSALLGGRCRGRCRQGFHGSHSAKHRLLIDPVYPWAVITLVYLVASLIGYLRTEARQREIRNAFSRYHVAALRSKSSRHTPRSWSLAARSRTMTIMFCDIRGFTSLAEGMDARTLTRSMNSFLSPMTEIITEQKGTIDKYIGDCIMAFWNAPLDDPEHARNAVRAAQAMRRELVELNRGWESEALVASNPSSQSRSASGSTRVNVSSGISAHRNISTIRCSATP